MELDITPSGQACGATITGLDLRRLTDDHVRAIRSAWLEHKVVAFPDQELTNDELADFTLHFGPFGNDTFFRPIDGHDHIAAIRRRADETSSLFAENWHADWSFQEYPPDGTCLYGRIIPPEGGDTLFADQQLAYENSSDDLKQRVAGLVAVHSARGGYAPDGTYGDGDDDDRSMDIVSGDDAYATHLHPLVQDHPETGRRGYYSTLGYIIGVDGLDPVDGRALLGEVYAAQIDPAVQYRHRWQPNMLVMWDNRSVLHRATGGYEGHERLLHRTTIGYNPAVR